MHRKHGAVGAIFPPVVVGDGWGHSLALVNLAGELETGIAQRHFPSSRSWAWCRPAGTDRNDDAAANASSLQRQVSPHTAIDATKVRFSLLGCIP